MVTIHRREGLLEALDDVEDDPRSPLPSLEPLEVHSGMVFGTRREPGSEVEMPSNGFGVRETLEEILLPALSNPPCLVAFSGGKDSSGVLALATDVARRHGLEDPVPITLRYDAHPRTWETEWQREVVEGNLGLERWEIVPVHSEFEALGPIARSALRRHGQYWPPNAHTLIPLLRATGGGTLLTGNGGDEVFGSLVEAREMTPLQILRLLPFPRSIATLAVSMLPLPLKLRAQYYGGIRLSWLRPHALREVRHRFVSSEIQWRRDDRHYLERFHDSRYLELSRAAFDAFAHDTGAKLVQPFLDPRFHAAALRARPSDGFPNRAAVHEAFFGDLLPPSVTGRSTKAVFTEVFWGPACREFSEEWDGRGLDDELIDPERMRESWARPRPDFRSLTPLQAAWLAFVGGPAA